MNMFNSQGEMNAHSLKDALMTLVKYAAILEENTPSNMGLSDKIYLSDDYKEQLLSRAIKDINKFQKDLDVTLYNSCVTKNNFDKVIFHNQNRFVKNFALRDNPTVRIGKVKRKRIK